MSPRLLPPLTSLLRSSLARPSPTFLSRAVAASASASTTPVFNTPLRTALPRLHSQFTTVTTMSDLQVELTAPNGTKYTQPRGLFINNEWVKSSDGKTISSINPTYGLLPLLPDLFSNLSPATSQKSQLSMLLALPMSTQQLMPLGRRSETPPGETCLRRTEAT